MKKIFGFMLATLLVLGVAASANAMVIGYFDTTREVWGFDGNNYLTQAKQNLIDEGHTLVNTNYVDDTFLSGVDAFYTGLISSVASAEIDAMQNFVDVDGGFLFIQTDWAHSATWTDSANSILANWGIGIEGNYQNDSGHYTTGTSDWVTDPNVVTSFIGAAHSVITTSNSGFEYLGYDDLNRGVLGVYDAGAGRSSDVLIATDINFWDDTYGWSNQSNRDLWENIWSTAGNQIDPVPEPSTILLMGIGLIGLAGYSRKKFNTKK